MRILFLSQRVPYPPNRGDKIPTYYYVRHLARAHDVTVACLADGREDLVNAAGLRPLVRAVEAVPLSRGRAKLRSLAALAGSRPLTAAYFDEPELRRRVRRLVKVGRFDLAFVFSSGMAPYVEGFSSLPRVIQFADLDSQKWAHYASFAPPPKRWIYQTEARRLLEYERRIAHTFTQSLVCSPRELEDFHRLIPGTPVRCIANGVNLDFFHPTGATKAPDSLVFTGVMDYLPNVDAVVWFCRDVLPRVRAEVPGVTFTICGASPDRRVRALAGIPGVTVTGSVPAVRPYLDRAEVAVVPLRIARGIQNKLLEAMASGLPVVATPAAVGGIQARDGRDLFVADAPDRFAAAVVGLLRDAQLRAETGSAARAAVEANYRWERSLARLDEVVAAASRGRVADPTPPNLASDWHPAQAPGCRCRRPWADHKSPSGETCAGWRGLNHVDRECNAPEAEQ
jgi:sugar transferase (PEP-CTERM/EpsH1 system associated)